ncbi:MAG: DUF2520 domain-containing protein [Chitinophagaceae bacterium]|nr:DUF2520 domain-containing protein [Chitinophagaceae bacterium]
MRVVLVGAGNTATVLGKLLIKANHKVTRVISRTPENAKALAELLGTEYGNLNDASYGDADLYIVALQDQIMGNLEGLTALHGKFLAHTAGAIPMDSLKTCTDRYGVFYPLQTLSKYVEHTPEIPFMVDGNTDETLGALLSLANSLSNNVTHANDKQRMGYHVAAVFAANFANHMYALTEIYCQRENIDFKNMVPLINEICKKVNQYSPFLTQTGPAIRNDVMTISRHLENLSQYQDLKYMYVKVTESIMKLHGNR